MTPLAETSDDAMPPGMFPCGWCRRPVFVQTSPTPTLCDDCRFRAAMLEALPAIFRGATGMTQAYIDVPEVPSDAH